MAKVINAASPRHHAQMELLADFAGVDEIEYEDLGNGEVYTMRKGGQQLVLKACGNRFDGGFLCVDHPSLRPTRPSQKDDEAIP